MLRDTVTQRVGLKDNVPQEEEELVVLGLTVKDIVTQLDTVLVTE